MRWYHHGNQDTLTDSYRDRHHMVRVAFIHICHVSIEVTVIWLVDISDLSSTAHIRQSFSRQTSTYQHQAWSHQHRKQIVAFVLWIPELAELILSWSRYQYNKIWLTSTQFRPRLVWSIIPDLNKTLFNLGVVPRPRKRGKSVQAHYFSWLWSSRGWDEEHCIYRMPTRDGCPALHCTGLYPSMW